MYRYEPTAEMDLAVAGMWSRMKQDGDLDKLFTKDGQSLSDLYSLFKGTNRGLFFEADEQYGIWFGMWFEQIMGVAFLGVWVAKPCRNTHRALKAVLTVYEHSLRYFPAILGVTKQEGLLDAHVSLGYTVMGEVPGMWDGQRAWLLMLTRAGFLSANRKRLARLRLEIGE